MNAGQLPSRNRESLLQISAAVVHASSKCQENRPRRVLHIEYAMATIPLDGLALAIA